MVPISLAFADILFLYSPQSLTVDEIVHRHVDAIGVMANLKAIQTVRRTERAEGGSEFVIMRKRGNKFRNESVVLDENLFASALPDKFPVKSPLLGKKYILACDGQNAWSMFTGQDPQPMNNGFCKSAADIDDLLVDYKQQGYLVELMGKELVEHTEAYHLKLKDKGRNGATHFYLDTQTFLIIKLATRQVESIQNKLSRITER